ncbi:rhomboid-related protein 3 isoform X2 [Vespa velutina]|uniref:rhomboid-related protein 3 isoform X2 n=1 Tax=Vespa velutina TaxID=202808 RepID=UPI001FB368B7|nr:rhomboid-related protein 3 isoform X2 [Vespa velutina]
MLLASGASIPTIAGAVEEEEEYARSEANSAHYDGYVTDHTDLASEIDIDESEYRRELLNDKWRMLFDKFDPEGFGEIPLEDFLVALKSAEWKAEIPTNKRDILLARAKESKVDAITFQDFVNVMSGKRTRSFKCAVHHRDREVCSENDFHLLVHEPPLFRRMVRMIGDEFLTEERDRKYYADHYTCCPPPLFIILITLVELGFFTYYTVAKGEVNPSGPVPIDSVFIYRPDKRLELWRFAFYMFLHAGWLHLLFNLGVQVVVGLPLEMVHGSLRIAAVYMAGVLAASADVGFAIYDRYAAEQIYAGLPVSYVAHLTGALAGLTIGLLVLKNFEQRLHEQLLWWVALGVYAACTIFAVMYNLMHPNYP